MVCKLNYVILLCDVCVLER